MKNQISRLKPDEVVTGGNSMKCSRTREEKRKEENEDLFIFPDSEVPFTTVLMRVPMADARSPVPSSFPLLPNSTNQATPPVRPHEVFQTECRTQLLVHYVTPVPDRPKVMEEGEVQNISGSQVPNSRFKAHIQRPNMR
ncbi:hypothetical protein L1987_43133 [Smallanthus sonchifolius]|uniref:Uncharacterized protein n=1 Tax=Smallanthus sonchifolius TaxID=185202 RepID=A0ACB9GLH0_9ASTR|nr:hypothetical protein L1987_43133 [Smallanthus sonchifolius]